MNVQTGMTIEARIQAFVALGNALDQLSPDEKERWLRQARAHNNWFTPENVELALRGIRRYLREEELTTWLRGYSFADSMPKRVGVVMAGNIPAVGFHDFLCVLLSGHTLYAKLSSQDPFLLPQLARLLTEIEPLFAERIVFAERLNEVDAMIATGSDNSARYFYYYFGKKPHIIRQNRTSCAILTGEESDEELQALGRDIFQYFGLGCRNVSKLYVPVSYSFDRLFENLTSFAEVLHHHKYVNNYDYNKSIYLINQIPHLDTGFLLLTPSKELVSPISVLYVETYENAAELTEQLNWHADKIQAIIASPTAYPGSIPFGEAQCPHAWDYADRVDTMQFLLGL